MVERANLRQSPAIEVRGLVRTYGRIAALRGLNLCVERGECYGLLGPNGAGKSTLLHVLLDFLRPDAGTVHILGLPPAHARTTIGYLPEQMRLPLHTTANEYLHDLGFLSGLRGSLLDHRCQELFAQVGLVKARHQRISSFSKGMQQRLGIAQALLHNPEVLFVDEPTSGLDPAGQHDMIGLLHELHDGKRTILICTHQLNEIEILCDRVGMVYQGQLVTETRVRQTDAWFVVSTRGLELSSIHIASLQAHEPTLQIVGSQLRMPAHEEHLQQVLRILLAAHVTILEVRHETDNLLELYQRAIHGGGSTTQVASQ